MLSFLFSFFFLLSRSDGVGGIATYLKKNGRRLAKLAASCNPKPYTKVLRDTVTKVQYLLGSSHKVGR